ncbi:1,2-phenylacetyl-CoA epoxidase subunit PaaC [Roseiterribacter gracilis]|uniref:Phenylacetate-CoA oxygenase subunit PaaI n=1 Tax=Roseiterribacter gracilis TaxID=2812848 RepID=A0A8S8X8I5_9PROT|nr:phenylacetate-CoA oxygenase subunit PaaI [Rhodospirillales bacterium TMPK1]
MGADRKDIARYAISLGDDSLILGQRLGEWCGHAPTLEIDLFLANIALDLIGQATLLLDYAGTLEGEGRDGDKLAFHRDVLDFTNCLLVEQPNGDFGRTIARQFLFSNFQLLLFQALSNSTDATIAGIARKAAKEVAYHARVASEWMVRLGDGTEESAQRVAEGLDWSWRFVDELFEAPDAKLIEAGVAVDPASFRPAFDAAIDAVLRDACLARPADRRATVGGRRGHHSEHLGHLLSQMQFLQRTYPDARW